MLRFPGSSLAVALVAFLVFAGSASAQRVPKLGAVAATRSGTAIRVVWTPRKTGTAELRLGTRHAKPAARLGLKVWHVPAAFSSTKLRARLCLGKRCGPWVRKTVHAAAASTPPTTIPPASAGSGPTVGSCPMFPPSYALNQSIASAPVDPRSDAYIRSIGLGGNLHPDFGSGQYGDYGIPYEVVPASTPLVPVLFTDYGDESDPGPYPVPLDSRIEGGASSTGDRHVIVVHEGDCKLYEMDNAHPTGDHWTASGGAVWNLNTGAPRPAGWTSADAAGLPILAGLARYDEVASGAIHHALRFTVNESQKAYVAPASHYASSDTDPNLPPMGLRLRLRADFDLSPFHGQSLIILQALKTYGMVVADNGSSWYISGTPDTHWNDDDLDQLKGVPGDAFQAVQTGPLTTNAP